MGHLYSAHCVPGGPRETRDSHCDNSIGTGRMNCRVESRSRGADPAVAGERWFAGLGRDIGSC